MVTEVVPGSLELEARRERSGAVMVAARIVRWFKHFAVPEDDLSALALVEYAGARFGKELFAAQNREDLVARIDAQLEQPDLARVLSLVASATAPHVGESLALTDEDRAEVTTVLGGAVPLIAEGMRLTEAMHAATARPPEAETQIPAGELDHALWFVTDSRIHPRVAEMMLDGLRGCVSGLAIAEVVIKELRLEPWLPVALAEQWRDGLRSTLRLLASLPQFTVPLDVVPAAERVDLAQLEEQNARFEGWLGDFAARAAESGLEVYPAGAGRGDD